MNHSRRDFFLLTLLLLLILALAAGVRFYDLAGQSLWSDEGNSAALATRSLLQIGRDAAGDIHPPLYYWMLHAWTSVFGTSESALRALSAALGVCLVFATAELGRRLYGEAAGLTAAFIAALAPFQVYYSQEARMYVLLALLATLSFLQFISFIRDEEDHLRRSPDQSDKWEGRFPLSGVSLLLCWVAGLYTQYTFPVIIAVETGLYVIWLWATRKQAVIGRRLLHWAILLGLAMVCFAPWLPIAWHQVRTWPTGGSSTMDAGAGLLTSLALLANGVAGRDQWGQWQQWALVALALVGILPWRAFVAPWLRPRRPGQQPSIEPATAKPQPEPALPEVTPLEEQRLVLSTGQVLMPGGLALGPARGEQVSADRHDMIQHAANTSGEASGREMSMAWYWLRWLTVVTWAVAPIAMMLVLGLFRDAYFKFLLVASPAFTLLLTRGVVAPIHSVSLHQRSRETPGNNAAPIPGYVVTCAMWALVTLSLIAWVTGSAVSRYFTDPRLARDDYRGIVQFITATAQAGDAILLDAPGQQEVFDYYYHGDLPVFPLPRTRPMDRQATLDELSHLTEYNKVYTLYWATQEADPEHQIENWMDNRSYKMLDQWRGNVRLAVYMMPEQSAPDETSAGLNQKLGSDITLLGYQAWNLTPHAGEVTQLQLVWRADQKPASRYKVFLQLLDPRDQVIAQRDAEPAGESRPTDSWLPGETIADNHGLLIPPGTPPGTYRRIVGLYDAKTLERLHLPSGEDHIDLPPIRVSRSPNPPPLAALDMQISQSYDFGGVKLLGYDLYKRAYKHAPETPLNPGDRLHVTFYWQANTNPRADWWFDLVLSDNTGESVADLQAPLVGQTYSTTLWEKQEIVRGEHDLTLPADLPPGTYRLSLTLLPDANTPAGMTYLGTVKVENPKPSQP